VVVKMAKKKTSDIRLTPSAIFIIGLFCSALALAAYMAVRYISVRVTPTLENSEYLLSKRKPKEAISHLDKMGSDAVNGDSYALMVRGKALFSMVVEQMRKDKWGSYGVNPENWISNPLAEEAEKCFLDAMALSPDDPEIRLVLGNLYREQGRFSDAELILRSSLEIDNANAEAYLALGLLYAEGSRKEGARKALAAAWELDEGNPKIAKNIAYFHRFYVNEPESSIVWFSRYLHGNTKRDADFSLVRAELENLLERYPEYEMYKYTPGQDVTNANRGTGKKFTARNKGEGWWKAGGNK
jgi:tetratricopeptide (TPR) repeat protein